MLVLDSSARKQIENLRAQASQFPIPHEILEVCRRESTGDDYEFRSRELRAFLRNSTIHLDFNYSVTFTVEARPYGVCRHLSISVDGGIPENASIHLLMDAFGFQRPPGHCLRWEEAFGKNSLALHLIEPIGEETDEFREERLSVMAA